MSVSKSIRKKRRQSKKRNMRGGDLPTSMAILSYNTSFVLSMASLVSFPASENTSIYIRLMKLKTLMNNQDTVQNFIKNYYGTLFLMSCKIIAAFFLEYGSRDYCVAALQEMNLTQHYLTTMGTNFSSQDLALAILACGVQANTTGLAYIIPSDKIANFRDKVDNNEWFSSNPLYGNFNAQKVAIVDLGEHQLYRTNNFYKIFKDGVGTPDNGRPMTLVVRNESDDCYTLHFNCHIPNPSALKAPPYTKSILENHSDGNSAELDTWATITYQIINEVAGALLLRFFSGQQISELTPDKCRIIFSGDFNDGTGKLMTLMKTQGLNVAGSGLVNIPILFSDSMPISCCSNFNSVKRSGSPNSPPSLKLDGIDQQKSGPPTNPILLALLNSTDPTLSQYDDIVDATNYAFIGDGTGSNIALVSQIYDPTIASGIPNIGYRTLTGNNIRASDHMPVVSYTSRREATSSYERTESRRSSDDTERVRRDERDDDEREKDRDRDTDDEDNNETSEVDEIAANEVPPREFGGGYRKKHKKRKTQRKLSQRKLKRYTKKRKYKKSRR
jgi:hypothetical protein